MRFKIEIRKVHGRKWRQVGCAILELRWSTSRRARSARHDLLVQFLIYDLDSAVDVRFQLPTGYDAVISKEVAGDLSKPAQIEARSPAIGKNKAVSRARKMAQTIATRARDRSPALTACERC